MIKPLPFKQIPGGSLIYIISLNEFNDPNFYRPHMNDFMMLLLVHKGLGQQLIEFRAYEMRPSRLFFIQRGQVHVVKTWPEMGWLLLFDKALVTDFLSANRENELLDLMDGYTMLPFIDLDNDRQNILRDLFTHLEIVLNQDRPDLKLALHYLLLVFMNVNQAHKKENSLLISSRQTRLMRSLKDLINRHFLLERKVEFYSRSLNIDLHSLNKVAREMTGKTLYKLIVQRLVLEAKTLLTGSEKTIKEITYLLNFSDMAQFNKIFRKHTGKTPSQYRQAGHLN